MYCPSCGDKNTDGVKFCRVCGTNLIIVSEALTGKLSEVDLTKVDEVTVSKDQKRLESGVEYIIGGLGFAITAIMLCLFGTMWVGVWFFIPAFSLLGKGISKVVGIKYVRKLVEFSNVAKSAYTNQLPPNNFESIPKPVSFMPPPSITERTTRNLDYAGQFGDNKEKLNNNINKQLE